MPEANASVFPEPVADPAMTSSPSRMRGIDFSCISVGFSNPCSFIAFKTGLLIPSFLKFSIVRFSVICLKKLLNCLNALSYHIFKIYLKQLRAISTTSQKLRLIYCLKVSDAYTGELPLILLPIVMGKPIGIDEEIQ